VKRLLLTTLLAATAGADDAPRFERPIVLAGPGRVALPLDREVYAEARSDLADLRVLDDTGRTVPFVVDRDPAEPGAPLRPELLNRGFRAGESASVTLDFGEAKRKSALHVSLSGDNFRRRVVVEGSADGRAYSTLVDDAWLFAIPGAPPTRFERVTLPAGDQRFLRLSVHHGPDDPRRIEILDVSAEGPVERLTEGMTLAVPLRRAERALDAETLLTLDLPGPRHPFREIALDVATPSFLRSVAVEAQRIPAAGASRGEPAAPGLDWTPLADGVLYRYESGGRLYACTRLAVSGRERRVRLRIRNRDDAPLDIRGASLVVPRERLLFEAGPGRQYRLVYGAARASAPSFDLARTLGDPVAWSASAQPGRLSPPLRTGAAPLAQPPWTERHPALLWAGLVLVTLALGGLTWRALRGA
jgi:Protein of unknown function (DUF3999)